jgi:4-hydroxy-4-methyl-2-oxoglutarate aldolase
VDQVWLTATLAADAAEGKGVLPGTIRPLRHGARLVGTVSTCAVVPGDNASVRAALEAGPQGGPILVVGGAAESPAAIMGGLVAEALSIKSFTAVVTDGLVRDSEEVAEFLKVWCRGATTLAPVKKSKPAVGEPVTIGGVSIAPGDYLVADTDGVVVWPAAAVDKLRELARERDARDQARAALLRRTGKLDEGGASPASTVRP